MKLKGGAICGKALPAEEIGKYRRCQICRRKATHVKRLSVHNISKGRGKKRHRIAMVWLHIFACVIASHGYGRLKSPYEFPTWRITSPIPHRKARPNRALQANEHETYGSATAKPEGSSKWQILRVICGINQQPI